MQDANALNWAIILAGGKGERLRPLTNNRPKPMIEIAGKPILLYIIDQLKAVGITNIILACSYMHEVIERFFGDGSKFGIKAYYTIEDTPLGRGGAIKKAMSELPAGWEDVFATNGDQLWLLDIPAMVKKHTDRHSLVTDLVVPLHSPYGIVEFDSKDEIIGFKEKPILPHWINAGVYIFNKEVERLLPDVGDHETETFPMLDKKRFIVFQSTNYWRGVDTVKDKTEAEKEVAKFFK